MLLPFAAKRGPGSGKPRDPPADEADQATSIAEDVVYLAEG